MSGRKSVIIDAVRSPIGVKRGMMNGNIRADDLSAQVLSQLMDRNTGVSRDDVEDVIMGCAFCSSPDQLQYWQVSPSIQELKW